MTTQIKLDELGYDVTTTQDSYDPDGMTTLTALKVDYNTGAMEMLSIYYFESEEALKAAYDTLYESYLEFESNYQEIGVQSEFIIANSNTVCMGTRTTIDLIFK